MNTERITTFFGDRPLFAVTLGLLLLSIFVNHTIHKDNAREVDNIKYNLTHTTSGDYDYFTDECTDYFSDTKFSTLSNDKEAICEDLILMVDEANKSAIEHTKDAESGYLEEQGCSSQYDPNC